MCMYMCLTSCVIATTSCAVYFGYQNFVNIEWCIGKCVVLLWFKIIHGHTCSLMHLLTPTSQFSWVNTP